MSRRNEPWYIHAVLYTIIAILVFALVQVAIIKPTRVVEKEKYWKTESRLRMNNIRQAEILWERQKGNYVDNLDTLIHFIKTDTTVQNIVAGIDTMTGRASNPFVKLTVGEFVPESLFVSPKSGNRYTLKIDSSITIDTVINRFGRIVRIDTTKEIGNLYFIECPDGYGSIGDVSNNALKNTASWE
ncbi:MAG: hypothetical protein K9J12_04120 [Melioribacteraceae bacterium]|nr:hypothetical protein [Melioribacteraceae bacterium]MCF8263265.1 hypothetical protein [Melioribacteraceae bacterium]MCF8412864.1 hypothetical protein [Melioribacteraceae bacterium]MCF8430705.1 hypothetical protein [Melioribacteraceae bacterium]